MESQIDNLMLELSTLKANRRDTFYEDHNNNYYKDQLKRDQKLTSVGLIKKKKAEHIKDQAYEKTHGKKELEFSVDKKVVKKANKKPLDFIESEIARSPDKF